MPRKFKGQLATPIQPRTITNYLMKEQIFREWAKEDWEKIELLCGEYEVAIDDDLYMNLTLALAKDFVPGFKEIKRRGIRKKWSDERRDALVIDIERIMTEQKCSKSEAAKFLSKQEPWCNFLVPKDKFEPTSDPGEALRRQYYKRQKNISSYSRARFEKLLSECTIEEWKEELRDLFGRE